jgi:methylated-DNA-protein-cysteine methyltransferase-like protein
MKTKRKGSTKDNSFGQRLKDVIKKVPKGKVATYGQIAALAGNPRAARQVVRILHSSSEKDKLPWFRIVNRQGRISLKRGYGYEIQNELLRREGIKFDQNDTIDFDRYLWSPSWDV